MKLDLEIPLNAEIGNCRISGFHGADFFERAARPFITDRMAVLIESDSGVRRGAVVVDYVDPKGGQLFFTSSLPCDVAPGDFILLIKI